MSDSNSPSSVPRVRSGMIAAFIARAGRLFQGSFVVLAPVARVLAALSVLLLAAAFLLQGTGTGAVFLVAATTMALLAIGAGFSLVMGRSTARLALPARLLESYANDPDPVLLTDRRGAFIGCNLAIRTLILKERFTPTDLLSRWSAEPRHLSAGLIADAMAGRPSRRDLSRAEAGIRVSVHRADPAPAEPAAEPLLVWRFSGVGPGAARPAEPLGVPVLTLGPDWRPVGANMALRQLMRGKRGTAPTEAEDMAVMAPLLGDTIAALRRGSNPELLALPGVRGGGQTRLAFIATGLDGQRDVLFLPPWLAAGEVPDMMPRRNDFEDIPVALVLLGADGRIMDTNRLARGLLGLAPGEHRFFWEVVEGLGRPVSDWLEDAAEGRALNRPEVLRANLPGQETYVQVILRRATGTGGSSGLVAVISDATEMKSLEARFVQSQKMQAIGQLAGGVAHDFNNLLTAISGHCDLLLLNRDHFDPDYNDLVQIHQNSNRAAALVRQLLAFSRKQTMKPEILSVESLLEDLTHLLTRLVGERITLTLIHDPELGSVRADRRQLEQVVMNLVVNARDAMPMGGEIRIETEAMTLDTDSEQARVRLPKGDYAVIRVIDEGVGIPADLIDKIFEPFFTTKRQGEGTGLGLSTAYGIVKQMGGWIFADSTEGTGTVFTLFFAANGEGSDTLVAGGGEDEDQVSLIHEPLTGAMPVPTDRARAQVEDEAVPPAAEGLLRPVDRPADASGSTPLRVTQAAEAKGESGAVGRTDQAGARLRLSNPTPPTAEKPPAPATGLVLLVEDEAPVRAFAARALRLKGYQVLEAENGEQALDLLEDKALKVDLFVTDVIMPGMDGPTWVAQALTRRPGTPVVFVSGYTEDSLSAALARIPRSAFLGKPFTLNDLSETIARQMALRS